MSKLSQSIAILGVVAGLGVAALPLSTYAADAVDGLKVTDQGNTEGSAGDGKVENNATVTLNIKKKLSIELDKSTADLGDGSQTAAINVTVVTNNVDGYTLNIAGTKEISGTPGDVYDLAVNSASLLGNNNEYIPSVAGPWGSTDTSSSWGIKVAKSTEEGIASGTIAASLGSEWNAVPDKDSTPLTIMTGGRTKDAGEVAVVTFGANIIDGQASGTYTGQVTFTASDVINN